MFYQCAVPSCTVACIINILHLYMMTLVVNKFETSLTDDARDVIYDRHMFIVQATGVSGGQARETSA
jgi:hypothetical protein